jgi:hypothetical protein
MTGTIESVRRRKTLGPRKRSVRPILEGLEDRMLLYATSGGSWVFPSRITYSFAPDGTSVGGVSSNLFATLNAVAPTATWQATFEKAAALWSSYANINLALVSDSGASIGAAGNEQDDPRFGDIRFAMIPQQMSTLAYALLPSPLNGGSDAGDIVFNSNIAWKINNNYDVETVALHEIGHALGLEHSAISSAVMYAYYNGMKQAPTTDDISGIRSIYGAYPADQTTNISFTTATDITAQTDANQQIAIGNLNLSGPTDEDWFYVTVPSGTSGSMTVSMQSTNLSSVSPRLGIWNSAKVSVASGSLVNVYGGTETLTLTGVTAGQGFYIRASAASSPGAFGAYGLLVNFGSVAQPPIAPPNTVVLSQPDMGGGSSNDSTAPGGLSAVITEMKNAESHLYDSRLASLLTIELDATLLMVALAGRNAKGANVYGDLLQVELSATLAVLLGNVSAVAKNLDTFFADVFQVGDLAGYADALTVSQVSGAAAQFGHADAHDHAHALNHAGPSQPVIPGGSTVSVVVNLHNHNHNTAPTHRNGENHHIATTPAPRSHRHWHSR